MYSEITSAKNSKLKIRKKVLLFIIGAVGLCMSVTQCCNRQIQRRKVENRQDVYENNRGRVTKMTGKGQTRCNQCDIRILLQA